MEYPHKLTPIMPDIGPATDDPSQNIYIAATIVAAGSVSNTLMKTVCNDTLK
jgi:hypothetical protein